jgi:pyruvate ferredoxin oxidoreductase alpha subunit
MERVGMEGSFAIAEAVKLANADVIAAYPITPQTHIVEKLAAMVADGDLDADYIPVESEHSAMSACLGSAAVGARTFTATAGQGLELMHEVLYVASGSRLPIVMSVCNRALSGPLSIWGDHSDAMAVRDVGWIQMFTENVQQAFDLVLCAFRIAEDRKVLFPTMVHIDGFHLSHVIESLYLLDKQTVDKFLLPNDYPYTLNPKRPVTIGAFAPPNVYTEAKKMEDDDLKASKEVITKVWKEYGDITGRYYSPVEEYKTDDADILLITMGSFSETAMIAIDDMRNNGIKVGLVRIRLWRPFPYKELRNILTKSKTVIVLDRAISFGALTGPVCAEVQAALYPLANKPKVVGVVGGLGGRDISAESFENIIRLGMKKSSTEEVNELEIIEVRL